MNARCLVVAGLAVLAACAASKDAPHPIPAASGETVQAQAPVRRPDGSYLLASIPTSTTGRAALELVLPQCRASACAERVRLVEGAVVYDSAALEWESVAEPPQRSEQPAGIMGVGDRRQQDRTVATWVTGDGEDAIATLARPLAIAPGSTALLVHQSGGAEHVKRLHYLFVADGRRLIYAWLGWEGQGLTSSSVDTIDVDADGRPELLFWRFAIGDDLVSDWQLSVDPWDTARRAIAGGSGECRHSGCVRGRCRHVSNCCRRDGVFLRAPRVYRLFHGRAVARARHVGFRRRRADGSSSARRTSGARMSRWQAGATRPPRWSPPLNVPHDFVR